MECLRLVAYGLTDRGLKRSRNEDRFLVRELEGGTWLLAVADGMGGGARGDLAAQAVVDVLAEQPDFPDPADEALAAALLTAHSRIQALVGENLGQEDMGTTATAAVFTAGWVYWAHVGDSRLYHQSRGRLRQVTTDHRFLQDLLADGTMTPEQAAVHPLRNVLDQCVGCSECRPDSGRFRVEAGDRLLLCSDGLTLHLDDKEIAAALTAAQEPRTAAEALVQAALDRGGGDNVTVIMGESSSSGYTG